MPRDGSNVYAKPSGTTAVSGATIGSAPFNQLMDDIAADLNIARPIVAGGTGATSASGARTNLGLAIGTDIPALSQGVPAGAVMPYAASTAPTGWLLCYGQAVSRTTYAALFAVISTTYGAGDGSTTFNVPDCRDRVVAGLGNMGGTSANRLTDQPGGVDGDTLGDTGGSETHTLTEAELAAHDHGAGTLAAAAGGGHSHTVGGAADSAGTNATNRFVFAGSSSPDTVTTSTASAHTHTISGSTAEAGSGDAHNNVQPTIILSYIIKT